MKFILKQTVSIEWAIFALAILCAAFGLAGTEVLAAATIPGLSGGKLVTGEPLTTDITRRESPELLRSEVDKLSLIHI